MTISNYPSAFDVLTRLHDEFDKIGALDAQLLLDGIHQVMTTLGADPSDPNAAVFGTGWGSFTDVADILGRLARIQRGRFALEYPVDPPLIVDFPDTSRFSAASDVIVHCAIVDDEDHLWAGQPGTDPTWSTRLRTSGSTVTGFDFYRHNMDHSGGSTTDPSRESWEYVAMQESL